MTDTYLFDFTLYHTYSKLAGFLTNILVAAIAFMGIIMLVMGKIKPLQIIFYKGQVYKIDKIKDICRRAADVGGVGDRYTCMIQGKERELWFED